MAEWIEDRIEHPFRVSSNLPYDSVITVFGAKDKSNQARPLLVFEDHPESKGLSALEEPVRSKAVQSLTRLMKIQPDEADWFIRHPDGRIQSVSVSFELSRNPDLEELERKGELSVTELREAAQHFPDIMTLKTAVQDLDEVQTRQLFQAHSSLEPAPQSHKQDPAQDPTSGRDIDLSIESF